MAENILAKLFEHNNWANAQIIEACSSLDDTQLDAEPQSATLGSIRGTLFHLVTAQQGYLRLLTLPLENRLEPVSPPAFAELQKFASLSGEALLALARDESSLLSKSRLQTRDGFYVEPWVLMVQIINHATEHREQIKSMLSALGVTPPSIDGWDYGELTHALIPAPERNTDHNAMGETAISQYITDTFEGVETTVNFGYTFFFYGSDRMLPFATIANADYEYDHISKLDRPGVFRLNIGVSRQTFQSLFGTDKVDVGAYDFTALDKIMPHPEYAAQSFVCVLSPGDATIETVRALLAEGYDLAVRRHSRRPAQQ